MRIAVALLVTALTVSCAAAQPQPTPEPQKQMSQGGSSGAVRTAEVINTVKDGVQSTVVKLK